MWKQSQSGWHAHNSLKSWRLYQRENAGEYYNTHWRLWALGFLFVEEFHCEMNPIWETALFVRIPSLSGSEGAIHLKRKTDSATPWPSRHPLKKAEDLAVYYSYSTYNTATPPASAVKFLKDLLNHCEMESSDHDDPITIYDVDNDFDSDFEGDLSSEEEVAIIIHILANNCTSILLLTVHFRVREEEIGEYWEVWKSQSWAWPEESDA